MRNVFNPPCEFSRMIRALLLLILIGCSSAACPEGFVSSTLNESRACISAVSYCTSDDQCTSARFDCAQPCAHLPVNILFSSNAREKENTCKSSTNCPQVPIVENKCLAHQCVSLAKTANELIPPPVFREVISGKNICYELEGRNAIVHLDILNNATTPLTQIETVFNVTFTNGSRALVPINLLNETLDSGESRQIQKKLVNATPHEAFLFAVRPVTSKNITVAVRNRDSVGYTAITPCHQTFN